MTQARDLIIPGLTKGLRDVIEGAAEDLQTYAAAIADDLALAASEGREDLTGELFAQARTVAEINRLRIQDHAWDAFRAVLRGVVAVTAAALSAGLLSGLDRIIPPEEGTTDA